MWNGFFCCHYLPSLRFAKCQLMGWESKVVLSKRAKKLVRLSKKKAKWFGYALWRLAYYLGLNFRNQTNYFDHSYTHCSKGIFFQKVHEIFFFLPSFVSFVIIVNITLKPLTNYSEYSFKSAELICFFQCKVFFLHSDA